MPRGPRTLAVSFGAKSLTHYGGVYLVHRFLSRLGFKHTEVPDDACQRRRVDLCRRSQQGEGQKNISHCSHNDPPCRAIL